MAASKLLPELARSRLIHNSAGHGKRFEVRGAFLHPPGHREREALFSFCGGSCDRLVIQRGE